MATVKPTNFNESFGKIPADDFYGKPPMNAKDFLQIGQIVYEHCGIRLNSGKEQLVRSRLSKRLRDLGVKSFGEYLKYVQTDKTSQELDAMIDCLTTNKTAFFREEHHFNFLRSQILPALKHRGAGLRIWSAGCSSGEEPYSIAILLSEEFAGFDKTNLKILATDISSRVLAKARFGEYESESVKDVPAPLLAKYFSLIQMNSSAIYRINDTVRKIVRLARLNLMDAWPMKGPFDVIFCRNVMIYFDTSAQRNLVQRYYELLNPGGYLLVGHSESLLTSSGAFKYVQPATYVK
jgi:chemotaxis protein methyltransferase CheR